MSWLQIADTGLFIAMGQPSNSQSQAVRWFARRNGITLVLPERVYEELTIDDPDVEGVPVDTAIDEGWATVAVPLESSEPVVSRVMDGVQRYIANADDRPADEVERADAALAAQHLSSGGRRPKCVCIRPTSRLARGAKPCPRAGGTVTRWRS